MVLLVQVYVQIQSIMFFIGIKTPDDIDSIESSIVVVSDDFKSLKYVIPLYENFPSMKDVQGVAYNHNDNTLWICSFGENKVHHITSSGSHISSIDINKPTGIAYDPKQECLWILTYSQLLKVKADGEFIRTFNVAIEGQDQLCYDEANSRLLMTVGLNYHGTNYVYEIDIKTGNINLLYKLEDSYAIEGIALYNGFMYIANDGMYHSARIPVNQINRYNIYDSSRKSSSASKKNR